MQIMATLQRFIANYSRINQSARWGLSLNIDFCVTVHMLGAPCWEMPWSEKATDQLWVGFRDLAWSFPQEEAPLS